MRYDLIVKEVNVEELGFTDVVMVNGKFQEVMGFTNIDGKCTLYFSDGTCIVCYTGDKINIAEGYEKDISAYHETFNVTQVYPTELLKSDAILVNGKIGIVLNVNVYIDTVSVAYISDCGVSVFITPKNDMPKITRIEDLVMN